MFNSDSGGGNRAMVIEFGGLSIRLEIWQWVAVFTALLVVVYPMTISHWDRPKRRRK